MDKKEEEEDKKIITELEKEVKEEKVSDKGLLN